MGAYQWKESFKGEMRSKKENEEHTTHTHTHGLTTTPRNHHYCQPPALKEEDN